MSSYSFLRENRRGILCQGSLLDSIETPAVLLRTYMGNLLYSPPILSEETYLGHQTPLLAHLELGDFIDKDFGTQSLHSLQRDPNCTLSVNANFAGASSNKFAGAIMHEDSHSDVVKHRQVEADAANASTRPKVMHLLSARSLRDGIGVCSSTGVAITTPAGRKNITPAQYAQRILAERPHIVVALADESPLDCPSKNRLSRAAERTKQMFQEMCDACGGVSNVPFFLFGVALPGSLPGALAASAAEVIAWGAKGISLGGVNLSEDEATFATAIRTVREAIHALVSPDNADVQMDVPLLVPGCNSLRRILIALENGADLVESNIPFLLTTIGHALALDWDYVESIVIAKNAACSEKDGADAKRRRISTTLDLWDKGSFEKDKNALMGERSVNNTKCHCHACRNHTRAYIHHLLRAKELLSEVLLYNHNQAQLLEMLRRARMQAKQGTLAEWISTITEVYDLTEVDFSAAQSKLAKAAHDVSED